MKKSELKEMIKKVISEANYKLDLEEVKTDLARDIKPKESEIFKYFKDQFWLQQGDMRDVRLKI